MDDDLTPTPRTRNPLAHGILFALIVLATIGAGSIVLQREVAATIQEALLISIAWAAIVGGIAILYANGRSYLTRPLLSALALGAILGGVAFYFGSVRDTVADEQVARPTSVADAQTAVAGLAPETSPAAAAAPVTPAAAPAARAKPAPAAQAKTAAPAQARTAAPAAPKRKAQTKNPAKSAPNVLALASGVFTGQDGHSGSGKATVVQLPGGQRTLTFTDFDVSPGAKVEVWLTTGPDETQDKIVLGGLKGNRGNQQYTVPPSADLNRYSTVVLYCIPFTVRIAVAPLRAAA